MAQVVSMTQKGQVTIPKDIRQKIGATEAGTKIEFLENGSGEVIVHVFTQDEPNLFAQMAPGEGYEMIKDFGFQDSTSGIEGQVGA
jgi:AbrB family looped-hinge helix DNA binding protein